MQTPVQQEKAVSPAQKSAARLAAVQALYAMDVTGAGLETTLRDFIRHQVPQEADKPVPADFSPELFTAIMRGAATGREKIDALLDGALDAKYRLERLEKILRSVFRAGTAELVENRIDPAIIINDYVSIARGFFEGKEPGLVNAVLDKIAKSLQKI